MHSQLNMPASDDSAGKIWFPQKIFWILLIGLIVIYCVIGSMNPKALTSINIFLTPAIRLLKLVGLGVKSPFIDGEMPKEFYTNLVGIAVYGVVFYNLRTLGFLHAHKWNIPASSASPKQGLQHKPNWSPTKTWFASAFLISLISIYCPLCVLNGINGWVVFHTHELLVTIAWPVLFLLLPGTLVVSFWFALAKFVFSSIRSIS